MNRRGLAVVASGVQTLVVFAALMATATSFDSTELMALGVAWPALAAMEFLRSSADLRPSVRAWRILLAGGLVAAAVSAGLMAAGVWQFEHVRAELEASREPSIVFRWEDVHARHHALTVPRDPGESTEAHRERAAAILRAFETEFPTKGQR